MFCKIQAGREIEIDIEVSRFNYVVEVVRGIICFIAIPISILILKGLDKIGVLKPLENWLEKRSKKKRYLRFV